MAPTLAEVFGSDDIDVAERINNFKWDTIYDRGGPNSKYLHDELAPSYGTLNSESIGDLDEASKVAIAGVMRSLAKLSSSQRTAQNIESVMMNNTYLEPAGDSIDRTQNILKDNLGYFKISANPDNAVVKEVLTWWTKLIADKDVLNSTINKQQMANIVAQSGDIIDMSEQFWSKSGAHEQKMLDIGVLRFPDSSHPYFKLYRIKLSVRVDMSRTIFPMGDLGGITGGKQVSHQIINSLQANWIWTPDWVDSSRVNTTGRIVHFSRELDLPQSPTRAQLHFSADTRYKLFVNGVRVAVGPARSSPWIWYYDTLDIAPYLSCGRNVIRFVVVRYFASSRGAMPFERTTLPGLTVVGSIEAGSNAVELDSHKGWQAQVDDSIQFPMGLIDDGFLHADTHSTAFLRWAFQGITNASQITLKVTYSEGYELEPRSYPYFRKKTDRLDAKAGHLIGPYDAVTLDIPDTQAVAYEPFWFRTFRLLRLEIIVGEEPVRMLPLEATQVNYPLAIKASWTEPGDEYSERIWDVSIRTMRNCIFDGYSDCPFYEQLQYSGDSRAVGLFHYLLSGDDRLMRQAITNFAASVTFEGLTQSRFPSHVPQLIAGFPLYWILQVCDHHLYFGDTRFARSFLPRIDGVLDFFDIHIDSLGLVSGLPEDVWQYVDWVTTWGATEDYLDKGVPTSGRKSNRHTYFSMLYAYVLQQAARLVRDVGRPGYAEEYEARAAALQQAIRVHCYDGHFFTDSTADIADEMSYSQHCQVFAVLSGTARPEDHARLLNKSFADSRFAKCSYMMRFYALRALSLAGDQVYDSFWPQLWDPWRNMLANNLSTWEEDDVRQRSDCHAWSSVPIYEYCTELAGIRPIAPGSSKVLFKPRLGLSDAIQAKVALGKDNVATISWTIGGGGEKNVELRFEKPVEIVSQLPGGLEEEHGVTDCVMLVHKDG
ncbi:Six-hairpin glycosidase-like protein [Aspergillus novoparasiticus]|uniref:Six-hairpin glycosidase-like protein n=1 Tax=Aspergillus novoparasiticus TaxID=986946 RepID=A0A5N6EC30_9EURO|nr:Six-hairpin glycosidase-like protein [Aspergillus novoparasiticus]